MTVVLAVRARGKWFPAAVATPALAFDADEYTLWNGPVESTGTNMALLSAATFSLRQMKSIADAYPSMITRVSPSAKCSLRYCGKSKVQRDGAERTGYIWTLRIAFYGVVSNCPYTESSTFTVAQNTHLMFTFFLEAVVFCNICTKQMTNTDVCNECLFMLDQPVITTPLDPDSYVDMLFKESAGYMMHVPRSATVEINEHAPIVFDLVCSSFTEALEKLNIAPMMMPVTIYTNDVSCVIGKLGKTINVSSLTVNTYATTLQNIKTQLSTFAKKRKCKARILDA